MGVGDRHLENILVTKDGKLLHIDFSYVLGDDPKNLKVEMKITQDMVNMLGGPDSKYFKFFKESCTSAYKKIRLRSSLWYILLSYLEFSTPSIDSFKYDKVTIKNHIIERLLPGENDKEASMQIVDIVDRSSKSSWTQNLAEFSHKIGNTLREVTQFNMEL
jgi:phosphatidylinositol 3-kinase